MSGDQFARLYAGFSAPIAALDCGRKCAPYNEGGAPFCCDTRHAVPTAYQAEWVYLQEQTDLWHPWQAETADETERLRAEAPPGQVLIECQGHTRCQRDYRAFTCRIFPFFPYLDRQKRFIGLSYYWEYEDRCWVISNLDVVTPQFVKQCIAAYDQIFALLPGEIETFAFHSQIMRRFFGHRKRGLPLLHRDGGFFEVHTRSGDLHPVDPRQWPKYGPYAVAAELPFPDEIEP